MSLPPPPPPLLFSIARTPCRAVPSMRSASPSHPSRRPLEAGVPTCGMADVTRKTESGNEERRIMHDRDHFARPDRRERLISHGFVMAKRFQTRSSSPQCPPTFAKELPRVGLDRSRGHLEDFDSRGFTSANVPQHHRNTEAHCHLATGKYTESCRRANGEGVDRVHEGRLPVADAILIS